VQNTDDSHVTSVALLYQSSRFSSHLKEALNQCGATVVYEASLEDLNQQAFQTSMATIVIVNLDNESDVSIATIHELLGSDTYDVIFNDAAASSRLQGWDHARWARHLAAKVLKRPDIIHPPRPKATQVTHSTSTGESLAFRRAQINSSFSSDSDQPHPFAAELETIFSKLQPSHSTEELEEKVSFEHKGAAHSLWLKEEEIAKIPSSNFASDSLSETNTFIVVPQDSSAISVAAPAVAPDWSLEEMESGADEKRQTSTHEEKSALSEIKSATFKELSILPLAEPVVQATVTDDVAITQPLELSSAPRMESGFDIINRVIVLGASIGGPEAVREFLSEIPEKFPALFVLAQHMGEEFLELMAGQLAKATALKVCRPTHNQSIRHGEVIVVPSSQRLQISAQGRVALSPMPQPSVYTPSIDQVLYDIADGFGVKALAIIFSGMARDAIEGSQYLADRGGKVWVQDPKTCVVSSMVDGAQEAGIVSFIGAPKELAQQLLVEATNWQ